MNVNKYAFKNISEPNQLSKWNYYRWKYSTSLKLALSYINFNSFFPVIAPGISNIHLCFLFWKGIISIISIIIYDCNLVKNIICADNLPFYMIFKFKMQIWRLIRKCSLINLINLCEDVLPLHNRLLIWLFDLLKNSLGIIYMLSLTNPRKTKLILCILIIIYWLPDVLIWKSLYDLQLVNIRVWLNKLEVIIIKFSFCIWSHLLSINFCFLKTLN